MQLSAVGSRLSETSLLAFGFRLGALGFVAHSPWDSGRWDLLSAVGYTAVSYRLSAVGYAAVSYRLSAVGNATIGGTIAAVS